jgi:hypothetical protein
MVLDHENENEISSLEKRSRGVETRFPKVQPRHQDKSVSIAGLKFREY